MSEDVKGDAEIQGQNTPKGGMGSQSVAQDWPKFGVVISFYFVRQEFTKLLEFYLKPFCLGSPRS